MSFFSRCLYLYLHHARVHRQYSGFTVVVPSLADETIHSAEEECQALWQVPPLEKDNLVQTRLRRGDSIPNEAISNLNVLNEVVLEFKSSRDMLDFARQIPTLKMLRIWFSLQCWAGGGGLQIKTARQENWLTKLTTQHVWLPLQTSALLDAFHEKNLDTYIALVSELYSRKTMGDISEESNKQDERHEDAASTSPPLETISSCLSKIPHNIYAPVVLPFDFSAQLGGKRAEDQETPYCRPLMFPHITLYWKQSPSFIAPFPHRPFSASVIFPFILSPVEIPMPDFNPVNVYSSELKRHANEWLGHALWYPDSSPNEVEIGDVGYIHEGRFMQMFNVITEAGFLPDEQKPQGFKPLHYHSSLNDCRENYLTGAIPSKSVKVTEGGIAVQGGHAGSGVNLGYYFECSSHQGAILHLNAPADMKSVQPNDVFPSYMKAHHRSWIDFLQTVRQIKRDVSEVLLVRGHVKASGWAVAAFQSKARRLGGSITANFAPAQNAGLALSIYHNTGMMRAFHYGPNVSVQSILSGSDQDVPSKNQCVFLRYYKIRYRFGLFPDVMQAAAGPAPLPDRPPEEGPQAVLASDDMEVDTEVTEPHEPAVLAVDELLDHILNYSTADIAIASDGEVEMLLGHENRDDIANYLRINQPVIIVDEDKVGRLSLESLVLGLQRQRRALAAQDNEEEADAKKRQGLVESQAVEEKAILASGKSLRWLDTVFRDTMEEGVSISSFSISNNSKYVLTGLDNDNIVLWDMYTGQQVLEYNGHEETVLAVAFSPDGTKFVSGGADSKARLWDVETHNSTVLEGHSDWVYCVAWAPDGKTIATGSFDYM
ncbi:hypothetical protein NM688_g2957 [Phlebia brevispora]|uniref:Uncharacterized protein n=1 Tax=Phlebia brevispora TaxID=194682 RepID=A0ACC1T703_9APHY|nr:hypothetical protein NM688_g2957 [Phlebia brevispora]